MNFGAIDHDGSTPDVQIDQYACPDGAHGGFGKPVGITEVSGEISRRLGNYSPVCGVAFATALMQHRQYPQSRDPIVRRGQLKLKAGVTKMRVLGDGYYSLAYRDDLARWDIAGPRVLSAGIHVNGPNGYVSGGLGAHLRGTACADVALERHSLEEIEDRLEEHIAHGVDVVKIAATHGDMGFEDAKPDLPEAWVREIVLTMGCGLTLCSSTGLWRSRSSRLARHRTCGRLSTTCG